jgi:hypothetical protein
MLSRYFHLRFSLKPLPAPAAGPVVLDADTIPSPTGNLTVHADYDRHSLTTSGFDHYIEWNAEDERFLVH